MADNHYESIAYWANALSEAAVTGQSDYVVSILRTFDLATSNGVRDLSSFAIDELQNNRITASQDAINLWQISQCLKKFRYGCTASPEEMQQGWVERNKLCAAPFGGPDWVLWEIAKLLKPLGPAFEATDDQGRFGNGAVYEGHNTFARWNALFRDSSYNPRCPDDIRWWTESPSLSARLSCVPKDMFKLRSITVEPTEATFLQQFYRSRLIAAAAKVLPRSSGIPQQAYGAGPEVQQKRALAGSLTGELATIDLSNASDCVRWDVIATVFPANIVAALERSRSPYCEINGTRHRVHMYAGMGNATTFIVETLFFWALCTVLSRWLRVFTPVSVFGDDIVLATSVARHPMFQNALADCGLVLNVAKSGLSVGPGFREACGLVAYQGTVLPLLRVNGYDCRKPEELVSLCSLVNDCMAPDSRYAPFVRLLAIRVGQDVRADFRCPVLPYPLARAGVYIADPSESIGEWSYRAQWDPDSQHALVKVKVLEANRGKTLRLKDLTSAEAFGILNGQLHSTWNGAPLGTPAGRKSEFVLPGEGFTLKPAWVPCWSSDASLLDLVSE